MDYTWITYTYTYIQRIYLKNIKNKYINSVLCATNGIIPTQHTQVTTYILITYTDL